MQATSINPMTMTITTKMTLITIKNNNTTSNFSIIHDDTLDNFNQTVYSLTNESFYLINNSMPVWNHPLLGILLIAIPLIAIFGNSLVIYAVIKDDYLKSAQNYYIASLACADLVVGLLVMPFNSINQMTNDFWFFGHVWCNLWHSLDGMYQNIIYTYIRFILILIFFFFIIKYLAQQHLLIHYYL